MILPNTKIYFAIHRKKRLQMVGNIVYGKLHLC
jgi:hypothetical protein